MFYLIANWKANKDIDQLYQWSEYFKKHYQFSINISIIICPPHPLIYPLKEMLKNLSNVFLGGQDLSFYEEGSYTGEVTAKTLKGLVQYVIIGHNERRNFFNEKDIIINKKIKLALKYNIEPILCVRNIKDKINSAVKFIAYEPPEAIGSGKNEDPIRVIEFKKKLNIKKSFIYIYGGSVNIENIKNYLLTKEINGFLLGNASLDPVIFLKIFNKLAQKVL